MNDYSYHTLSSIINAFQKSVNFPFKDLSLENVQLIFFGRKLIQKGRQFSCHLIKDRKVKDLSLDFFYLILFKTKVYTKGWQLSPIYR